MDADSYREIILEENIELETIRVYQSSANEYEVLCTWQ